MIYNTTIPIFVAKFPQYELGIPDFELCKLSSWVLSEYYCDTQAGEDSELIIGGGKMVEMVIETDGIREVDDVRGLKDRSSGVGRGMVGRGDIHQLLASGDGDPNKK